MEKRKVTISVEIEVSTDKKPADIVNAVKRGLAMGLDSSTYRICAPNEIKYKNLSYIDLDFK